jgi:hypothetical protein
MPQKFNSRDDTILAEGKSPHAMVAGRTQPARALIALNHRRILSMVATVHHFLKPIFKVQSSAFRLGFAGKLKLEL